MFIMGIGVANLSKLKANLTAIQVRETAYYGQTACGSDGEILPDEGLIARLVATLQSKLKALTKYI